MNERAGYRALDAPARAEIGAGGISRLEQGLARAESDNLRAGFHLQLAWAHVESGQIDPAHEQIAEVLELKPGLTVRQWRKGYMYKDSANLDRIADALKKAGLPE